MFQNGTPAEILAEDFSEQFVQYMRNRVLQGRFTYGPIARNRHRTDFLASLDRRIKAYRDTANTEFLVDAANLLMFEFMYPKLEGAYFRATSREESPGLAREKGGPDGAEADQR
jgi:hypothetical protein